MFNRKLLIPILFIGYLLGLFGGWSFAAAQDTPLVTPTPEVTVAPTAEPVPVVTPVPVPDVSPVFTAPDPDAVINAAFLALLAAFSTGILSPLTSLIVQLVKKIPLLFIQKASGDQINLAIAFLLSLGMWGGNHFGYGQQIVTGYKLLYAVLPILTATGANYFGSQAVYETVKGKIPLAGTARTID